MHYVTGPGDVCFRFSEDYKDFLAARKQCESEGAQLVNDQSGAVYHFVQQHLEANPKRPKIAWVFGKVSKVFTKWHRGYWVGARKVGGGFKWFDGAVVCVTLLDRLNGDQIITPHHILNEWGMRPAIVVSRYIRDQIAKNKWMKSNQIKFISP